MAERAWSVPEYLADIWDVEPALVIEIVTLFLQDAESHLRVLGAQISAADGEGARMTLHGLKGSSRQIGGLKVGDILEHMEESMALYGTGPVSETLPALLAEFNLLRSEIKRTLSKTCPIQEMGG